MDSEIYRKEVCGLDSTHSVHNPIAASFKHGIELPGSINDRKFLDKVRDYQLLK
jgi:hypothetical protein